MPPMPALAKPLAHLPRFVPHLDSGAGTAAPGESAGAGRGAGAFLGSHMVVQTSSFNRSVVPATTPPDPLAALAHDARNVLASLMLYGDLLAGPGVLTSEHLHLASELAGMTRTAAQLLERIVAHAASCSAVPPPASTPGLPIAMLQPLPVVPVTDLAAELRHLQPLLTAIAGPSVKLSIAAMPCSGRTRLAVEDLARILANLVRNAADAMPGGGHLRITAQSGDGHSYLDAKTSSALSPPRSVLLSIADDGPGIPPHLYQKVFDFGFTTRNPSSSFDFPAQGRRGFGLSTVRCLVEAAGGTVRIVEAARRGAQFEIILPVDQPGAESITSGTGDAT